MLCYTCNNGIGTLSRAGEFAKKWSCGPNLTYGSKNGPKKFGPPLAPPHFGLLGQDLITTKARTFKWTRRSPRVWLFYDFHIQFFGFLPFFNTVYF